MFQNYATNDDNGNDNCKLIGNDLNANREPEIMPLKIWNMFCNIKTISECFNVSYFSTIA